MIMKNTRAKGLLLVVISVFLSSIVQGQVQLLNPQGGEIFNSGEFVNIKWQIEISHEQENWDLFVTYDNGAVWEELALNLDVAQENFNWLVPDFESTEVIIRIVQDNVDVDYEDQSGYITILRSESMPGGNPDLVTGIDISTMLELRYFPNPASTDFSIEFAETSKHIIEFGFFTLDGRDVTERFKLLPSLDDRYHFRKEKTVSNELVIFRWRTEDDTTFVHRMIFKE